MSSRILLIGAGPMAVEYAKVLKGMDKRFVVIGRGAQSAAAFQEQTGIEAFVGGLDAYFAKNTVGEADTAIVCVNEAMLGTVARQLVNLGVKSILVEKPGGLDSEDIRRVKDAAAAKGAKVYVGYNRRFYTSVLKAQEMIAADGGVTSFHFEFTEWGHVIAGLQKVEGVKEAWFMANSSHVIDLAFFLGGKPQEICSFTAGGLDWHPRASVFTGAGKTAAGALFSYCANWAAPGRWSVEVMTRKHRYIFRPMEKLQIQKIGSVAIEEVPLADELDQAYKPGLYRQVEAFLGNKSVLPSIEEQVASLTYYDSMLGPAYKGGGK